MTQTEPLPITPEMLLWARESAGVSVEYVAKKINKESHEISSWEDTKDEARPTYAQLKRLSGIYKRPIIIFFLLEPPQEKDPATDLRTRTIDNDSVILDKNIRFLFREAHVHLEALYDLHDSQAKENEFLKQFSESALDDSKSLARNVRNFLNVSVKEQKKMQSPLEALKFWRQEVEKQNIFIFKRKFNNRKSIKTGYIEDSLFCGFCVYDKNFPIIYLNNGNSKTRQIFTLFHEIAHLIYRVSGVDIQSSYVLTDRKEEKESRIERLCNAFAADFLVPDDDFNTSIEGLKEIVPDDPRLEILSKEYSVSRNVILIKLYEREIIGRLFYEKQVKKWFDDVQEFKQYASPKRSGGGSYYNNVFDQTSLSYAKLAFENYYQKRISDYQLSDYLNIKIPNIKGFEKELWN